MFQLNLIKRVIKCWSFVSPPNNSGLVHCIISQQKGWRSTDNVQTDVLVDAFLQNHSLITNLTKQNRRVAALMTCASTGNGASMGAMTGRDRTGEMTIARPDLTWDRSHVYLHRVNTVWWEPVKTETRPIAFTHVRSRRGPSCRESHLLPRRCADTSARFFPCRGDVGTRHRGGKV